MSISRVDERRTVITTAAKSETGIALVIVLLAMMLIAALGMALSLTTSTETRIAASYAWSAETFYAADAAIERVVHDLASVADWTDALDGAAMSFSDGPPGPRTMPDGTRVDLNAITDRLNCGHLSCSAAELTTVNADRPWGINNPTWRLYAHGPLRMLGSSIDVDPPNYVVVWVSDDPLENDGQPLIDGDETIAPNPGRGILQVRAQAHGAGGSQRGIEMTLRRAAARVHVLSWREMRQD
jgi:type IV pilus assembly PilX-like protein